MKRLLIAILALNLSGCAAMVELDQKIARTINPNPTELVVPRSQVGLQAEAGARLAYYSTYSRKPSKAELQYAREQNAEFAQMVREDKQRVREESEVDPRSKAIAVCDIIMIQLSQQALAQFEAGQPDMYVKLQEKRSTIYSDCVNQHIKKYS
ncbi:hypothetical protein MYO4S_00045 [Serratia phage 4S]|nr:hypothetical protein MYO4S_00045 [Serratia phage 4S]